MPPVMATAGMKEIWNRFSLRQLKMAKTFSDGVPFSLIIVGISHGNRYKPDDIDGQIENQL